MAVLIIPTTPGEPYYRQRTKLEGREYLLYFSYNQRIDRWYLSIFDELETPLLRGIKLICNWPLLRHYRFDERLPPGEMYALSLDGNDEPPGFEELGPGRRVELVYRESGTT
jgi:hypothetical protein